MPEERRPDYSLRAAQGDRDAEAPALMLVKHFQIAEADYLKPPLQEQLLEPDGAANQSDRAVVSSACTCNTVCTCVPVSTCTCNTICTCNTVNAAVGVTSRSVPVGRRVTPVRSNQRTTRTNPTRVNRTTRTSRTTGVRVRPPDTHTIHTHSSGGHVSGGGFGGYWAPCF